jgi:hypothetical protein
VATPPKVSKLFLLVVNDAGTAGALRFAERVALRLELTFQRVDLGAEGLELIALGCELLLQVGEVALKFVGLGHGSLKGDDRDPGGRSRCLGRGAQGKA